MKQVLFGLVAALALTTAVQAQCHSGGYGYRPAPSYGYGRPVGYCNNYGPSYNVNPGPIGPGFVPGGVPGGVAPGGIPGGVAPGGIAPGVTPVNDGFNGNQPLLECHLAFRNDSEVNQRVFLQYRTVAGGRWTWMGQPGTDQAFEVTIPAGKTVAITQGGRKITASRIRVWTDGWNQFRGQDFWLVNDKDENGQRRYFAPRIATQTVVLGQGGLQPGIPVNNGGQPGPVVNGPAGPGPNTPAVVGPTVPGPGPNTQVVPPTQNTQVVPPATNPPVVPPTQNTQVVPPTLDPPVVPPTQNTQVAPPQTTPAAPVGTNGQSTTPTTPAQTTPPQNNRPTQGDDNIIIDPDRRPRQMGVLADE